MIELKCEYCGKTFQRKASEVNRNQKLGRKTFCSRKCQGHGLEHQLPKTGNQDNLRANNRKDDFSAFRWHLRNAKRRHQDCTITLQDLKLQWDKQNGICPYTGTTLNNADTTNESLSHEPYRASLDRIDSSKGYTPDNIVFVALMAQYAKHVWTEEDVIEFCHKVSDYHTTK